MTNLDTKCREFRIALIKLLYSIQTGHPGGSLSSTEIITLLYNKIMQHDPLQPYMAHRDRFVLSKGHAAPMLYLNLADQGYFPQEELQTLRQLNSRLQGHPCAHKLPGIELSTGPLGLGLSAGLAMTLAARHTGNDYYTYVLLGDGEIQEGCIWEAAMSASKFMANHLIAILDHNGVQLDGTNNEIMPMGDIAAKFSAFGWNVISCNGHSLTELSVAFDRAHNEQFKPTIIIANTVKGKGVSFMEGQSAWHGRAINLEEYNAAVKELEGTI